MLTGAVPLLAVFVNPHPLAVSSVVAADRVPWLLLALPAGAFADKFSRGPLMAMTNVLRAAAIAIGAFLILGGQITLATLILIVLVNAGGRAIYYSSLQAVVPDIVQSDALEYANGVLVGTETGHRDPRRPGRRDLVLRHEQGAAVLHRRHRIGAVLHPLHRLPLEGPPLR